MRIILTIQFIHSANFFCVTHPHDTNPGPPHAPFPPYGTPMWTKSQIWGTNALSKRHSPS